MGFTSLPVRQQNQVVQEVVQDEFCRDQSLPAALLHMHFHDCFVRGCDASILIDSTNETSSEKDAGPNQTVRGFELIDKAKKSLEATCPSTVSCADIITLATRDAVVLAGGPNYTVPTGRRDGLVSNPGDVSLPGPGLSVSDALKFFTAKRMTLNEMVTLLGAHTVGVSHCFFFDNRLSNFKGSGAPDPSMDRTLVAKLNTTCARNRFRYCELALDKSTTSIVSGFASNGTGFQQDFAKAMVKMGSIQVLVGKAGNIRKNCRVFN
uniref:peroxidase n=1 Tax=Fagus sylvatica TaxID=28930 RepID=A0A2N9IFU8_FAGSY